MLIIYLYLHRNSGQDSLFKTIEFVKTSPSTTLYKSNKYATHGLHIYALITIEDQNLK